MSKDDKVDPGPGAALLLGFLPELLRRATDVDRICGNCGRYEEAVQRCAKSGLLLPSDGPPWRDCRWFDPSEEFKKELAKRPTVGDLLSESGMLCKKLKEGGSP